MRGIVKSFPGVRALDGVDLDIFAGEVHALLGENGAGKSTLMKVISGVHQPEAGEIRIDGQPMHFTTAREAERAGIAIIYQELNLIPGMSVAENIWLGREPKSRLGLVDFGRMRRDALAELEQLEAGIDPDQAVSGLSVGEQQLVEIARALSLHARIVIMDEPTSALSDAEVKKLFRVIERLRQNGVAVIYITHKLDEIFAIADRVTVLRDGARVATRLVSETAAAELINLMVGRDLVSLFPGRQGERRDEILRVEGLTVGHPVQAGRRLLEGIDLVLHRGEILGIAGLLGSGRTELLMTLFGAPPGLVERGRIQMAGKTVHIQRPAQAIRHGLALVTEDRKQQGLFLQLPVIANVTIASLARAVRYGILRHSLETALVEDYAGKLRMKVPALAGLVETLSGGNQQKAILARWLLTGPRVLLLDDPTRGIDVGAKAEIYQLMRQFAAEGMGIILVSSELPEILELSDRILVLRAGRINGEFCRGEASEAAIMQAAVM